MRLAVICECPRAHESERECRSRVENVRIEQAIKEYRVYARKVPLDGGGYTMDHSALILVMGPDGTFRGLINHDTAPEEMAAQMKRFMTEGQS